VEEKEMLTMDEKAQIRHAVLVEGKSQREVARETGYSRNTVRKMLQNSSRPRYQMSQPRDRPILGPYKQLLEAWVEEDVKKPKKMRRTARRMYQLLQEEHGYRGAEPTVRAYVGKLRRKVNQKVYVPLSYAPGETGQVDFGEAEVIIAGQRVKAHLFVLWLGYSSATFVQAYPAETQEVFFAGHVAAFDFIGGVPHEIWYDNLTAAVQKVLKGSGRKEQESFVSFRTHYLFKAEFCNMASGWEKGGVEGRVGYVRRNWLVGAGEFESWTVLNGYLRERCRQDQQRQLRGRSACIGARLADEQATLRPLPAHPYPCCRTVPVKANHLALVTYATNRYSVPVDKVHEALTLRAYVDKIEISTGTDVIAVHERCWEREQDCLNPYHYLSLLAKRPRAFAHAQPIREWQQRWPPVFDAYFEGLKTRHPTTEATRRFIEVLKLGERYTEVQLAAAMSEALARRCMEATDVGELLRRMTETSRPEAAILVDYPALAAVQVKQPNLHCFDQLLAWTKGGAA
jgi:transposase